MTIKDGSICGHLNGWKLEFLFQSWRREACSLHIWQQMGIVLKRNQNKVHVIKVKAATVEPKEERALESEDTNKVEQ